MTASRSSGTNSVSPRRHHWFYIVLCTALLCVAVLARLAPFSASVAASVPQAALQDVTITPRGHFGGWVASATMHPDYGNIAYLGVGSGIMILDISDPAEPRQVDGLSLTQGDVGELSIVGTTACVAHGASLSTLDLSDPWHPSLITTVPLGSDMYGRNVAFAGSYAYVAAGWSGHLMTWNMSDPASPSLVGSVATGGQATKVRLQGAYAYVADGSNGDMQVYSLANPASPQHIATYNTGDECQDIALLDSTAYLVTGFMGELQVVDVSDPANPSRLGGSDISGGGRVVVVSGSTAYVGNSANSSIDIIDVSNPAAPSVIASVASDWGADVLAVSGNTLLAGSPQHGIRLLNVSTPASASVIGEMAMPSVISDTFVREESVPGLTGLRAIAPIGYFLGDGKLWTVDLRDNSAPAILGMAALGEGAAETGGSLWVSGSRAYVAWAEQWGGVNSGLSVFDVSDVTAPVLLGQRSLPSTIEPTDLVVNDTTAFLTSNHGDDGKLYCYDMSNPAAITELDVEDTPGAAYGLWVTGNVAYVAAGTAGVRLVDIATPTNMAPLGFVPPLPSAEAKCVAVDGERAFIGSSTGTQWQIQEADVSNPASPSVIRNSATQPGDIRDLKVTDSHIYAGIGGESIYVVLRTSLMTVILQHTACIYHIWSYSWLGTFHIIIDMSSYGSGTYTTSQGAPTSTPTGASTSTRTNTPEPSSTPTEPYVFVTSTNTSTATNTPTLTPTPTPTLTPISSASKSVNVAPREAVPGQIVRYTVSLFWDDPYGSSASANMVDALPEHLEYVAGTLTANFGGVNDANPRRLVWAGEIADGATAIIRFSAKVRCDTLLVLANDKYPSEIINRASGVIGPFGYSCGVSLDLIKPDIQITGMEVTQAIQNMNNDMRLIKQKETYVRLYLKTEYRNSSGALVDGCDVPGVTAELRGPGGQKLQPLNGAITAKVLFGQDRPTVGERDDLKQSLYWRLPRDWRTQNYTLVAEVNPELERPDNFVAGNNEEDEDLQFVDTKKTKMILHPIKYTVGGTSLSPVKSIIDLWTRQLHFYPTADEKRRFSWGSEVVVNYALNNDPAQDDLLDAMKELESWWWDTNETSHFGIIHQDVDTAGTLGYAWTPGRSGWVAQSGVLSVDSMSLGHEWGHNLGRQHVPCQVADGTGGAWAATGYPACWIADGSRLGYYGFDTRRPNVNVRKPSAYSDVMGYGMTQWISDFTYNGLYQRLQLADATPGLKVDDEIIMVTGRINTSLSSAQLGSAYRLNNPSFTNDPIDGPYTLELQNESGTVLASDTFGVQMPDDPDPSTGSFVRGLPYNAEADRIVLRQGSTVLATREASAHAPTVTITSPAPGASITDTMTVTWTASDQDDDDIEFSLLYSADGGTAWRPLALHVVDTMAIVDTTSLPGSDACLLRVAASDGFHTGYDTIDGNLTLERKPPQMFLLDPVDGAFYPSPEWVVLKAQAQDQDDVELDGDLVWTSHRDGQIGLGGEVEGESLSWGQHKITVMVTDSEGLSTSQTVSITIGHSLNLPLVRNGD